MEERNLELIPRREGTREKVIPAIVKFQLSDIENHFKENIRYIRAQFHIADNLLQEDREEEAKNIWRSQIVFLESAFDFYMHELNKYGLSEIFIGNWEKTEKYSNLSIKMDIVDKALNAREDTGWFLEFVNEFYKDKTLVSYESVKDQMNLLGLKMQEVADAVFYERDSSVKTKDKLKYRLQELYDCRNVIAHQAGRRHSDAQRENISKEMVEVYIEDVEKIVEKIQELAQQKG